MDNFSKNLDLGKQAHLFWDFNVRDVSACVLVPRRPCVLMLMFDVPQQIKFIEKKSTPGRGMRKGVPFPPIPPSHKLGPIDSRNTIHFFKLALREFALLPTRKNCFTHRTRIGSSHRKASIHASHPLHAPLSICAFQNLVHFSPSFAQHLQRNVLGVSFSVTSSHSSAVSGGGHFCAPESGSDHN